MVMPLGIRAASQESIEMQYKDGGRATAPCAPVLRIGSRLYLAGVLMIATFFLTTDAVIGRNSKRRTHIEVYGPYDKGGAFWGGTSGLKTAGISPVQDQMKQRY
jgi:hypothetical protein